jgi:hypothetical protein
MTYQDEIAQLRSMIEELRRMRNDCEPKHQTNQRYHAYSMAVSALNRVIADMQAEDAT